MRPTQAGNAGCEAKVPRALIARLCAWRSVLLVPLQHRGSSLTTSVRPRAEKDGENTQGQVGLDGGHRRPEVGLLRGEMPSCVVFRLTNSSIRQPLASLLLSKFNTRLRRSPHCWACLGPRGDERHRVTDSG